MGTQKKFIFMVTERNNDSFAERGCIHYGR